MSNAKQVHKQLKPVFLELSTSKGNLAIDICNLLQYKRIYRRNSFLYRGTKELSEEQMNGIASRIIASHGKPFDKELEAIMDLANDAISSEFYAFDEERFLQHFDKYFFRYAAVYEKRPFESISMDLWKLDANPGDSRRIAAIIKLDYDFFPNCRPKHDPLKGSFML